MALDKASLIKAAKPKVEKVEINGDFVLVAEISQEDYEAIIDLAENKAADGKEQNWFKTMSSLIIASVVLEDGSKMFDENDKPIVNKFSREIRKKLTDTCMKANGFNEEEKKPSEAITGASENGESQLDLDLDTPMNLNEG